MNYEKRETVKENIYKGQQEAGTGLSCPLYKVQQESRLLKPGQQHCKQNGQAKVAFSSVDQTGLELRDPSASAP